jgi:periplasmic divalent cation tolerance protein
VTEDPNTPCIALSTAPDEACARRLARTLVEARLAACVQIVAGVTSVYRWQGAVEEAGEWQLWIKTTAARLEVLRERLVLAHPYEVPEFIVLPVIGIAEPYRHWLVSECQETTTC